MSDKYKRTMKNPLNTEILDTLKKTTIRSVDICENFNALCLLMCQFSVNVKIS